MTAKIIIPNIIPKNPSGLGSFARRGIFENSDIITPDITNIIIPENAVITI